VVDAMERYTEQSTDLMLSELTPVEKVAQAKEWSTALMDVVNSRELYTEQNGNKYLHVEAWELIGAFAGFRAETESIEPISANDQIVGYKAKVVLVSIADGSRLGGGGIAMCGLDEYVTKGQKTQGAKHNAAMSMAQTRAVSKAFRMNFSYVAVLGGYAPTPADEMPPQAIVDTGSEYFCNKHGVKWFMKGKMRNYAHPIEGENYWCNMSEQDSAEKPQAKVEKPEADKPSSKGLTAYQLQQLCKAEGWSRDDLAATLGESLEDYLNGTGTRQGAWEIICRANNREDLLD